MTHFDKGIRSATRVVSGNTINAGLLRKAIVTDPWNGFTLCPNPSAANAEAYSALRAEITDKNALSSVKELATQAWWSQQTALTYDAHRDDRMITLLRQALQHHKNRLDNEKKMMEATAINFQIERLLEPLTTRHRNKVAPRTNLNPTERARYEALLRIQADHSLVTPQMLEDAKNLYAAHQAAETLKKNTEKEIKERTEKEHQAALGAEITRMQKNGWV